MDSPDYPTELISTIRSRLTKEEAPFLANFERELEIVWLEEDSSRLGNTLFEMDHHELFRRRRLRAPPGKITIGLHPMLAGDPVLLKHTLVHELLHACGLLEHSEKHRTLADELAPPPSLSESPMLQRLRKQAIEASGEVCWKCSRCGYEWERRTMRRPLRCQKCAHPI